MDMSLIHMSAGDATDRLFSHPTDRDDPRRRKEQA